MTQAIESQAGEIPVRCCDGALWHSNAQSFLAATVPSTSRDAANVLIHVCLPFSSFAIRGGTSFYGDLTIKLAVMLSRAGTKFAF